MSDLTEFEDSRTTWPRCASCCDQIRSWMLRAAVALLLLIFQGAPAVLVQGVRMEAPDLDDQGPQS